MGMEEKLIWAKVSPLKIILSSRQLFQNRQQPWDAGHRRSLKILKKTGGSSQHLVPNSRQNFRLLALNERAEDAPILNKY